MNTRTLPLAVAFLTLALSACQTPKANEKPRTISLADKSSRTANPVTYTWKASDGETAQLEVWWKDDGSLASDKPYGEVTAITLSLGDGKQAVPHSMVSDLWWPELD